MTADLLSNRRILVVEDEMLVLMTVEDMLADLGCTAIVSAATTPQALALIAGEGFDAAMVDMNLGGDRSFTVAAALAGQGIPFAFASGYSGHAGAGYDDRPMLRKPYRAEDLAAVMRGLLGQSADLG